MIVYLIYNRVNGKCYVGQTVKTLEERWYNHCKSARRKSRLPIHAAIRKYGPEAFMVGWLSHARDRVELNALERHFIARYNSEVPNGYNRTEGGDGFNGQHTAESRAKMRQAHLGIKPTAATRLKRGDTLMKTWAKGQFKRKKRVTLSADHRQRISEAIRLHWETRRKLQS